MKIFGLMMATFWLIPLAAAQTEPATTRPSPATPTSEYSRKTLRGWTVLVNSELPKSDAKLAADVLELVDAKLLDLTRVVPKAAVEKLRRVTIWIERENSRVPGGVYHPSRHWLIAHEMNPDKAKCVEFGNAKNFLRWSIDQPNLVLHEMSHAYHDQVLGFDNASVREAYARAKESKTYDAVLRINGHTERAYAMNNEQEYFAELSEAYFGTNDFFPFVRAEVKQHDPRMNELLKKVWGD